MPLLPLRPLTSYARAQSWIGHLIRNRRFQLRRIRRWSPKYVDLGCGRNTHPGFIHLDFLWHPGVDICWDVTRGLPFAAGEVHGIFSEHCLEHFSLPVATALLSECRRVLVPGGVLRVAVPDGELYLRTYCAQADGDTHGRFPFQNIEGYDGIASPILSVNRIFYQDRDSPFGHRFIYDANFLCALLRRVGFVRAEKQAFRLGANPHLLIDAENRACESLYVEAFTAHP